MVSHDHGEEKEDEEHQIVTLSCHGEEEDMKQEMMTCLHHV